MGISNEIIGKDMKSAPARSRDLRGSDVIPAKESLVDRSLFLFAHTLAMTKTFSPTGV